MYKLANSVLYSRDHTQGFILYCKSTHGTIIPKRDCKENDVCVCVISTKRKLQTFGAGPTIVGAVKKKYFQNETTGSIWTIWTWRLEFKKKMIKKKKEEF